MKPIKNISVSDYIEYKGLYFHPYTTQGVMEKVAYYYESGKRLRVFFGDYKTGKDYGETYDIIGTLGRSTGRIKIPLLIKRSNSSGGGPLSTYMIVRILDVETMKDVYLHPTYTLPTIETKVHPGYKNITEVFINGQKVTEFQREEQVKKFTDFIKGLRLRSY